MPHQILFREQYGTSGREVVYIKPPDQRTIVQLHSTLSLSVSGSVYVTLKNFFQIVFLPQGYPESVSKDYCSYQLWDTVQAFCSTLNGTLTTQAIMKGVGVGDQAATPLAAAVTWILKDGAGNVGRIFFAWWKGTSLDADCKKWRLFADIINDCAMLLELSLPYFMGYSTVLLCASTVLKSIVGVAGGATRAALTQHQAVRNNMADVSAKDGSQETCVNLVASLAGIALLTCVEDVQTMWILFFIFTVLHLYANYKAVKALTISTLNTARLNIILDTFLKTGNVPSPDVVNKLEAVVLGQGISARDLCGFDIKLGESVAGFVRNSVLTADQLKVLHHLYEGRGYILLCSKKQKKIFVSPEHGVLANSTTIVKSYFHAILLGLASNMTDTECSDSIVSSETCVLVKLRRALKTTCNVDTKLSSINAIIASMQVDATESERLLNSLLSSGWATGAHHLGCNEWRLTWPNSLKQGSSSLQQRAS